MKTKDLIRPLTLAAMVLSLSFLPSSCGKESTPSDGEEIKDEITVKGKVTDMSDKPVEGVSVSIKSGLSDSDAAKGTSAVDGTYSVAVSVAKAKFAVFEKEGYASVSEMISSGKIKDGVVEVNARLEYAGAKIVGRVVDGRNGNTPFAGAKVSTGTASATTGEDGKFSLENLTLQDYNLIVSAAECQEVTVNVPVGMFNDDGVAELPKDIVLGAATILPGNTLASLQSNTAKWFINEYRAGFGLGHTSTAAPEDQYGNATTALMSAQFANWYGRKEFQNEGCTLRIMSGEDENSGYAQDLKNFDSYTWGAKEITEDNRILSVYWRTHSGSPTNQVPWGVMVVDLESENPEAVSVRDMDNNVGITYGTDTDWHTTYFDLGDYAGKEIVIAIGLYRNYDGKCDYQLPLTHISFGPEKVPAHQAVGIHGTAVAGLEGWRMTMEEVRSMMPNPRKVFGGAKGDLDFSKPDPCFGVWAGTGHIASEWGLQWVMNTCTPDCGEGFMLQTGAEGDAEFGKPVTYFYSKFTIDSDHDKMSFYTRNFSSEVYTYFKLTVIEENGTVTFLDPSANNAAKAEKDAESGCWKFIHENGWSGDLAKCAKFEYDLSGFAGKDVVICIGLHRNSGPEQKLVFCGIEFE